MLDLSTGGVPLNKLTLSKMSREEQSFWEDFIKEAEQVVNEKIEKQETMPYTPPESLKAKYKEAITKYNGEKYCQIRQLQSVFAF